jgi:spore coat protein A
MSYSFRSSRRKFLRAAGLSLASLGFKADVAAAKQPAALDPSKLTPFVDRLPIPPVMKPVGTRTNPENPTRRIPYYRLRLAEALVRVHRDLPPTRMWCLEGSFPGPTVETVSGQGIIVDWHNQLPARHFLPVDYTLHGAEDRLSEGRSVIHLHGGRTPPDSDGYPDTWTVAGQTQTCFYPCAQGGALLFYHDHAMGINRLNIYAGLQGMFIVRDPRETELNLPSRQYEIPLLLADRLLTTDGQLLYPVSDNPAKPWVPEVFGDAMLVNGKLLPYHEVEPRIYRLRVMNGSNARFFRLGLSNRTPLVVIANDQGLLGAPAEAHRLPLAPAERTEFLVDFAPFAGSVVRLISDSFDLVEFRVGKATGAAVPVQMEKSPKLDESFCRLEESSAVRPRRLTLDETMDPVQRSMGMLLNNTPWHAPVTEKPLLNTTEIWELVNLTEDSHPIHLHLVRFQILDRRTFDVYEFQASGTLRYTGPAELPENFEAGWKDTVRVDSGTVTRIIVPFERYAGRYVWHCHILEHEDNEMMRPFEVVRPSGNSA